jgi:hypothetical protein
MLFRHWKYFLLPTVFLLVFLSWSRPVQACSCGRQQTVLDAFDQADVVLITRAVSVDKATPEKTAADGRMSNGENYVNGVKSTSMRVEQVFKGQFKAGDEMTFAQGGGADCIWTFNEEDIGKKFLFYLHRFKGATMWVGFTCGRSNRVDYAGDDLLYLNNLDKLRGHSRISGTLSFSNDIDETVAGRKIRINGAGKTYEVKTDQNGVYEIYDVPPGKYSVEPEIPHGWKVAAFWLGYSPSFTGSEDGPSLKKIPIVLEDKKHAGLDVRFEIDNAIRGNIYDPAGKPMNGVCVHLVPADGTKGPYLGDCTEKEGAFEIDEIPPGNYVIIVNDDGEISSTEPFGTFYYPNAAKREEATVFHIGLGDFVEKLQIYPPISAETITVEGVFLFSDGKPVAGEWVSFKSARAGPAANGADTSDENDARAETDAKGRFSIKILKGMRGLLSGQMYTFSGEFENCPQLEQLIKKSGGGVPRIRTPSVEIVAETNLYDVVVKYPFPGCKKAKID